MHGKKMPECRAHHVCHCLNDNNFNGKDCPFYKTAETVRREQNGGSDYGAKKM